MALDLFFVASKPALATLRAGDYRPTVSMTRARRKLIAELLLEFPGTRLEGDANKGTLTDFPHGEMNFHPGYIDWSLHGVGDTVPVQRVVDWFHARGLVCEDPQDAGFGNRHLKRGSQRRSLESFDELTGAHLLGVRLKREWGFGLGLDFLLEDGSRAAVDFVHFRNCHLPDLALMIERRVIAVHFESEQFDTLRLFFTAECEMVLEGAVYQKSTIDHG